MKFRTVHVICAGVVGTVLLAVALTISLLSSAGTVPTNPLQPGAISPCTGTSPPPNTEHNNAAVLSISGDSPKPTNSPENTPASPGNSTQSGDTPYGTGMTRGSKRLALTKPVPIEWVRQCLAAVDHVEGMTIDSSLLTPELIALLAEFSNVEQINFLNAPAITAEAGAALIGLTGVESIALGSPIPVLATNSTESEADFDPIVELFLGMPDLTTVESHGELSVNDGLLATLGRSKYLTRLVLRNYPDLRRAGQITTQGLLEIGKMTNLKELILSNFTIQGHRLDLAQLGPVLAQLPKLERLGLMGWDIKDEHLSECLTTLQRLEYLDVRGTRLSEEFYELMDHSWRLEELLASSAFGDKAVTGVVRLPDLRRLDVSRSNLGDQGLAAIGSMVVNLEELNLRGCESITDSGIGALQSLDTLKSVHLSGIPLITADSVIEFAASHALQELGVSEQSFVCKEYLERLIGRVPTLTRIFVWRCKNLTKSDINDLAGLHPGVNFRNSSYAAPASPSR